MATSTPQDSTNDDLDGCPMCGHLFLSDDGRCENCGEQLLEIPSAKEVEQPKRSSLLNWRVGIGLFLVVTFSMMMVSQIRHLPRLPQHERTFHQLLAVALGCSAVIGLVLLVQGIWQAIPRGHTTASFDDSPED